VCVCVCAVCVQCVCSVLQCVAVCCSVLQNMRTLDFLCYFVCVSVGGWVCVCVRVCVAVCCSVLQNMHNSDFDSHGGMKEST